MCHILTSPNLEKDQKNTFQTLIGNLFQPLVRSDCKLPYKLGSGGAWLTIDASTLLANDFSLIFQFVKNMRVDK